MKQMLMLAPVAAGVLLLAGCGQTVERRAATGGLGGAVAGQVIGGNTGATVAGAVVGAAVGAATTPRDNKPD
jgi:osmotically inducible lipoprotein OsmB